MGNLDVRLLKWDATKDRIGVVNRPLFDLLEPIALSLKEQKRDYLYLMSFKFGEKIIDNGQMIALLKDMQGEYKNLNNVIFHVDSKIFPGISTDSLRDQFIVDCGKDPDHPLALVIKNQIEIYSENNILYSKKPKSEGTPRWAFPLNIIKEGELFGVYGSVNSTLEDYKKSNYGWSGAAGKACILPLFPGTTGGQSSSPYRNKFAQIFSDDTEDPHEGIMHITNEILGSSDFAEIIIIPESYFKKDSSDNNELRNAKIMLREFLFKIAWEQSTLSRELSRDDKILMSFFGIKSPGLTFHIIKHIINIAEGRSFFLKPVSESDGILFDVFKHLVAKFKNLSNHRNNLLNYATPLFLHYAKLTQENPKGIEFIHCPSINIHWPEIRADEIRDTIIPPVFNGQKMVKYLKSRDLNMSLKYFKVLPKSELKSDKNSNFVRDLKEYIATDLNNIYSSVLGPNQKVILHRSAPALYNSFIHIEKHF